MSTIDPVSQVKLKLVTNGFSGTGPHTVNIHIITQGNWTETNVTWNDQAVYDSSIYTSFPVSSTENEDYEVDITPLVQDWISSAVENHGIALEADHLNTDEYISFGSKEGSAYWDPYLLFTYPVPEGDAALLTISSFLIMVPVVIRKKRF